MMNIRLSGRVTQCLLVVLAGLLSGCSVYSQYGFQSVSIAPDDLSFAVAHREGRESLLAIAKFEENVPTVVLKSRDGTHYERPIFSNDGRKLYFIARKKRDRGDLFVIGTDGSGLTQLTVGQEGAQNIQDIALSREGNKIYYINSRFYGHYSPIASSQPHDLDFYSISTDGTGLERLSFASSYGLTGLSISPSGEDIYSRSTILRLEKPRQYRPFTFKSPDRLPFTSQYPLSKISGSQLVLSCSKTEERVPGRSSRERLNLGEYSAVYGSGLFLIDIDDEVVVDEVVYLRSYLDSPALSHDRQRILFIRNDSVWGGDGDKTLWSVNVNGSQLRQIQLQFPQ